MKLKTFCPQQLNNKSIRFSNKKCGAMCGNFHYPDDDGCLRDVENDG